MTEHEELDHLRKLLSERDSEIKRLKEEVANLRKRVSRLLSVIPED